MEVYNCIIIVPKDGSVRIAKQGDILVTNKFLPNDECPNCGFHMMGKECKDWDGGFVGSENKYFDWLKNNPEIKNQLGSGMLWCSFCEVWYPNDMYLSLKHSEICKYKEITANRKAPLPNPDVEDQGGG